MCRSSYAATLVSDPIGVVASDGVRVRGGGFETADAFSFRSSYYIPTWTGYATSDGGFRCAQSMPRTCGDGLL